MNDFVNAFHFMSDQTSFMLARTVETLKLFGAGFGISVAIAIPLGVVLGHLHRGSVLAIVAYALIALLQRFLTPWVRARTA